MSKLALLGGTPYGAPHVPSPRDWPIFGEEEIRAVQDVVRSRQWGTGGPKQVEFEEKVAEFTGAKYAVVMTNGTHTLRLALEALEIGPGDEVIVPGSTWQATASSVLDVNAVPVLVDVDPGRLTIDPKCIEEAITSRTKAIIPVHLYGRVADMDAVMKIAKKYDLAVIEDAAHQFGSEWKNVHVGNIGAIGSFSLQASKILNTGEGGVVITNDKELYERMYSLKFCGRPRDAKADPPTTTMQSGNFRANEFMAAIGICQLARLKEQNEIREKMGYYLEDQLQAEIPGLRYLTRDPRITKQALYRMNMLYDREAWDGIPHTLVMKAFAAETEKHMTLSRPYVPLNDSPLYRPFSKKTYKLSDEYMKAIDPARFSLPVLEKAYYENAIGFDHYYLLAGTDGMDQIVEIFRKLYENRGELKQYQRENL